MNQRKVTVRLSGAMFAVFAMIAMFGTGCVGQQGFDELNEAYRKQGEQIVELKSLIESKDAEIAALRGQTGDQHDLAGRIAALQSERAALAAQLASLQEQLQGLQPGAVLPAELNQALMELAQVHPDLMTYDPALGMVRFRSDLTFALGSAQVSAAARDTISRLAAILRTPAASQYEVQVVGHTDNIPIRKAQTREMHPTNWHLSVHRAISVMQVLTAAGVAPSRVMVAGFGEYRPVAPNNGAQGNPTNRRVEIYLKPMTYHGAGLNMGAPATPRNTAPAPSKSSDEPPAAFK